ncbi:MAG: hypothetical protein ACFFDC_12375 [Promethearchaeota archaeon]
MAIYRNTTYDMEHSNTIEIPEFIVELESYLNNLLLFLKEENLDVESYATSLTETFLSKIKKESFSIVLPPLDDDKGQLALFPELREKYIVFCLSLLDIRFEEDTIPEKPVEISFYNILKSKLLSAYVLVSNLTSITSYDETIRLFQEYMDIRVETDPTLEFILDKVDYMLEGAKILYGKTHLFTSKMAKDGVAVWKAEKCMWHEILKPSQDSNFAYAVACHADFKMAKKLNPNFTLTRTRHLFSVLLTVIFVGTTRGRLQPLITLPKPFGTI